LFSRPGPIFKVPSLEGKNPTRLGDQRDRIKLKENKTKRKIDGVFEGIVSG
jgi:hypothetical protein